MKIEEKEKKIFISHSSKDIDYVVKFVDLLENIGLKEQEIICSSVPPYCIPLRNKVYDWLVDKFQNYELHVIYMLSHNYYNSAASLNEMGAAWAMKQDWTAILLPGFGFEEIRGCIDSTQIGIKLDDADSSALKFRLEELKNVLTSEFGLRSLSNTVWERKRDKFLDEISIIRENGDAVNQNFVDDNTVKRTDDFDKISKYAYIILVYASDDPSGQIINIDYISGTSISIKGIEFIRKHTPRELARWISAIDELLREGYIKLIGRKDKIYQITNSGYEIADWAKEKFNIDTSHDFEEYLLE